MAYSDSNFFDNLCDSFGNCTTMEQIAEFALTSKVILSYKIDFLQSFHDLLMKGLWKRSSNGCIYPLDNRYERILYVEINEHYEVDLEKSLEKLRNFSVTHQVFDDMSEPVSSSSKDQAVSTTVENTQQSDKGGIQADGDEMCVSDSGILQQGIVVCDTVHADNVLGEMSDANLSNHIFTEAVLFDDDIVLVHNIVKPVCLDGLEPYTCHGCMTNEGLGCAFRPILIERNHFSSAHNMLDELPLPTFIKEMAEAAKIAELNSVQGDSDHFKLSESVYCSNKDEVAPSEDDNTLVYGHGSQQVDVRHIYELVNEVTECHFDYDCLEEEIQLSNPLKVHDAISQPDFSLEIVNQTKKFIEANPLSPNHTATSAIINQDPQYSFKYQQWVFKKSVTLEWAYFQGLIVIEASLRPSSETSNQMSQAGDEFHDGYLGFKYRYFQVKMQSFILLPEIHTINPVAYVVWPLLNEIELAVNSSSTILGVFNAIGYQLENDWRPILNFREVHSWSKFALSYESARLELILRSYCGDFVTRELMLLLSKWWYIVLNSHSWPYYAMLENSVHVAISKHAVDIDTSWMSMFHYHRIASGDICLFFTHTLEDKGDFKREGVYPMTIYNICATNGYVIWPMEHIESMNLTWDPDIIDKIAYEQYRTSNVLRVGCQKDIVLSTPWLMKCWAASSWISDVGAIGYVNFGSLSKHWSIVLKFMDYTTMILGYVIKNQNGTVSIFDPGGLKSWLKMRNRLEAYQFTGCKLLKHMRYEDYQVYVLDLGGPLVRLVVGNTNILIEMIWEKKCAASSYKFLDVSSSFFIFDPGGTNESVKGETYHTCSVTFELAKIRAMLKWRVSTSLENGKLNNLSGIIFVFDPGGLQIATWSYVGHDQPAKIKDLQPKRCFVEPNLILEDNDHFKGRVLIHFILRLRVV